MDSENSMFRVTRSYAEAEKGICKALDHTIIITDTIEIDHELETLTGFYCPTCNKFWREP
jgi:hypothetical protein